MEVLEIPVKNPKSAGVKFSPDGTLTIHGVSCDEDPKPFYEQLKNWTKEYLKDPQEKTELFIRLKYFNTSSSKCLFEFLKMLTQLIELDKDLFITWYYEEGDEDMLDSIQMFEDLINYRIEPVLVVSYIK